MMEVSDEEFQSLIDKSLSELPGEHVKNIKNVAILYNDWPNEEQIRQTNLQPGTTLLGLYEGVPLSQRQGQTRILPDKITLFKYPLMRTSSNIDGLKENIKHTLWHEIAHYYGLDHDQIRSLE